MMEEALEQAKELAEQELKAKFGEAGVYAGSWDSIDVRHMLGTDGFILAYTLPNFGKKLVVIGANRHEMWLEKIRDV